MARLLLLQPLRIYKRWPLPEDFTGLVAKVPTLAFPALAGALRGHEIDYLDGIVTDYPLTELTRRAASADAVLINAHSSIGSLNTEANLRHVLETVPGVPIILGGHHATVYDYEWLGRGAHFVVRGEGEIAIQELVEAIGTGGPYDSIAGLSWRDGDGEFRRNPARQHVKSLDDLPLPDWSILDTSKYTLPLPVKGHATTVETSRGCSFGCTFCAASEMWDRRQRFKSADRLIEEFRILTRMGFHRLWFSDDNFGVRPKRDLELYDWILREGIELGWMAFIRADTVLRHRDAIAQAAKAGFKAALVGFESPAQRILGDLGKGVDGDIYEEVAHILRRNGIFIAGFFIAGYIGETEAESAELFKSAAYLADYPIISIFEPRRGTPDFMRSSDSGDLPGGDMFYHNTVTSIRSQEHVLKQYRAFYAQYLSSPRQIRRLIAGTPGERSFYRLLYTNIARSILRTSPSRVMRPWEMVRAITR